MNNRPKYALRLFLAILIATFIFINVFFFAYIVSYFNYVSISKDNNLISEYVDKTDRILKQGNCSTDLLVESSDNLDFVGSKLSLLEQRFGKNDARVLEQKQYYTSLELKHYQLVDKINKECKGNFKIIFFFYSNLGNKQDESGKMSFILGSFKGSHVKDVMIYSFDFDLNDKNIEVLKKRYNLKEAPIVVAQNTSLYVRNIDDLENLIFPSQ